MTQPTYDISPLGLLGELGRFLKPQAKVAFTPSPAVAQAVMAQAQGGMPPGGDPSGGGGMPPGGGDPMAGGGMPPGPPPGMDPAAAAAGGATPPGPPPSGGDPATQASPPQGGDPLVAKMDQLLQLMQQNQSGGAAGGTGPNGKPNTASIKFEPAHMHQIMHDLAGVKHVMVQMADQMGLKIDASKLLQQPAPAPASTPVPGQDAQAAGPAGPAGPPPSQIAQQLPALPPVAAKAAKDAKAAVNRLAAGRGVPMQPGDLGKSASVLALLQKRRGGR